MSRHHHPTEQQSPRQQGRRQQDSKRDRVLFVGALVLAIAAFVVVEVAPWLGYGLAVLLPTPGAQVAAAASLPVAVIICHAIASRRPYRVAFPSWAEATITGLVISMFLIAPFGRGHSGSPGATQSVPWLVATEYLSWPVLALSAWWIERRRRRRVGDEDMRPTLPAPKGARRPRTIFGTITPAHAAAAAVPVVAVAALIGLGAHAGPPPRVLAAKAHSGIPEQPQPTPRHVSVPALVGTDLQPAVSAEELTDQLAILPAVLAEDLTGGQHPDKVYESALSTGPTADAPNGWTVFLTVDQLGVHADLAAARAHLATAAPDQLLDAGWIGGISSEESSAAVLDGHDLLVLRILDTAGTRAQRDDELAHLAGQLTAERRAELVSAVTH